MGKYKRCSFKKILLNVEYDENNNKKAIYLEMSTGTNGYIIGDCIKYEGTGNESSASYFGDYEPGRLINRKAIKLYKVLIDYNNIVLVNKEDGKII